MHLNHFHYDQPAGIIHWRMNVSAYEHTPVLLDEVLLGLNIRPDGCYVDCTFGRGGHSRAILQKTGERGRLFAFDKDPDAIHSIDDQLRADKRFTLFHGSYTMLREIVAKNNLLHQVDGVLLDLGVSSPQLEDANRGFSFRNEGPLDMRMDNNHGMTAAGWLNTADEKDIAVVLKTYGEERFAGKIAKAIVTTRLENKIVTTRQLADLISKTVPIREKDKHPATRSFQAIRIFINHELDELKNVLAQSIDVLTAGGRLVVISFHSLEDRIVKRFMRDESRGDNFPPDLPVTTELLKPRMKLIGKAVYPSPQEVERNPRARSAVLRIAERLAA